MALAVAGRVVALITVPEASVIIGCAMRIHTAIGPGALESAYSECLAHELTKVELPFTREVALPLTYEGVNLRRAYVAEPNRSGVAVTLRALRSVASVPSASSGAKR